MSLTMTKAEDVIVFTVSSNPNSRCPLICQLLGTLCCSPGGCVHQGMKKQLGSALIVLGTLQIMVGLMNVGAGFLYTKAIWSCCLWDEPFWIGGVFIAVGITCILAGHFPGLWQIIFTVLMNLVSFGLAITAIVLYSVNLANMPHSYDCSFPEEYGYRYRYETTTTSPLEKVKMHEAQELCERNKFIIQMLHGGLDILMILLSVLQFCITISCCVLCLKALCKKNKDDEVDRSDLRKPLVEDTLYSPEC